MIKAVVIHIIKFPTRYGNKLSDSQHRDIENSKTRSGYEYSADQKVVYGLFSLKFHHTAGNNVAVRILSIRPPSVNHCVKHYQIKPDKHWSVKQINRDRRIAMEHTYPKSRCRIPYDCTNEDKQQPERTAPFAKLFDRLVSMFFLNHINNVSTGKVIIGSDTGKYNNQKHKQTGYTQRRVIQTKCHFGAFYQKLKGVPEKIHQWNTSQHTCQRRKTA